MTHLVIHLIDELDIYGLVGAIWCYLMEKYLNVLNKYVRNRAQPEACMATRYMYDEVLGFALYPHTRRRMWDSDEEETNNSEFLEGQAQFKKLSAIELEGIHDYIITNFVATKGLIGACFTLTNCFQCYGLVCNSCLVHA
jgi:hypothetical protein